MWTWNETRRPRPNVKIHPLDQYEMPKRLRGEEEGEVRRVQTVMPYVLTFLIVGCIVGTILMVSK